MPTGAFNICCPTGFLSPSVGTAPSAPRLGRPRRSFSPPSPPILRCPRCPFCAALGAHFAPSSAVVEEKKIEAPMAPHISGACGAHSFKYFRRVMRIPNMCLVLKLDNGKVVSTNGQTDRITDRQNHRVTEPSSTVLVYRFMRFSFEIYIYINVG